MKTNTNMKKTNYSGAWELIGEDERASKPVSGRVNGLGGQPNCTKNTQFKHKYQSQKHNQKRYPPFESQGRLERGRATLGQHRPQWPGDRLEGLGSKNTTAETLRKRTNGDNEREHKTKAQAQTLPISARKLNVRVEPGTRSQENEP